MKDDEIVGHIAFSPVSVGQSETGWYGLGPVSVAPDCQRRGIGAALISEGLNRLREQGAAGAVVLGDPAYYGRFGFDSVESIWFGDAPSPYFQRLVLKGPDAAGKVTYHTAFGEN